MAAVATATQLQDRYEVVLHDGPAVHLRPVRSDDLPALAGFLGRLSIRSFAMRFFSAGVDQNAAARWAIDTDDVTRCGLVALTGSPQRIVGHVMYVACDRDCVEIGLVVSDEIQGHGLGTALLTRIAAAAQANGFREMVAEVMPGNQRMLAMLRDSGFPFEFTTRPGVVHARSPLDKRHGL
jgi:RimJ/RimL family protein N-acetyltransferase